jgi:hypothetical protein
MVSSGKVLEFEICSMFGEHCRHCSREHSYRPYTKIEKDKTTGLFKPVGIGNMNVDLGLYCNDAGEWVDRMNVCPIKWDATKKEQRAEEYKKRVEKEKKNLVKKDIKNPIVKKRPILKSTKRKVVVNKKPKKVA